ncbi:MAG: RNA polymerase sigma factor [Solirubrobacterales bacterium]
MSAIDEKAMIARIVAGENALFEDLYERYRKDVFALAWRMCGNQDDALDVVSETFLKAYRGLARFEGKASFSTWLYRITVNEANNSLRRRSHSRESPLEDTAAAADDPGIQQFHEQLDQADRLDRLRSALAVLDPDDRLILSLKYDQGKSYEDISRITGMPSGTIGTRLHRAKKQLMQAMKEGGANQ